MGTDLRLVKTFWEAVEQLVPDEQDRQQLHSVLREYRGSLDLERLIRHLRRLVNSPRRLPLYETVRPLIPLRHQMAYDARVPRLPSEQLLVAHLQRSGSEPFGFSVRGGAEHGVGFFVTYVSPRSHAWEQGLLPGDQLLRVDGFRLDKTIGPELCDLLKSRDSLTLKLRRVGLIPRRIVREDPLTWEHASIEEAAARRDTVRLFLNVKDAGGVGCSVATGPDTAPGVFIRSVKVGSAAEQVGLEVGDELVEANGQQLRGLTHAATVLALKASPHLLLCVRKARPLQPQSPISAIDEASYAEVPSLRGDIPEEDEEESQSARSESVSSFTINIASSSAPQARIVRGEFELHKSHAATSARRADTFEEQEITTYF